MELVHLDRLAGRLSVHPEHATRLIAEHGAELVPDWSGRPSVPVEVAAEVVDTFERRRAEHAADERAYKAYRRSWYQQRDRIAAEAARETHEKERKRELEGVLSDGRTTVVGPWVGGIKVAKAGQEAAADAVARWEKKNRLLDFPEWRKREGSR